jgi:hypothetical protein
LEDAKAQASVKTQPHQTGPFSREYKDWQRMFKVINFSLLGTDMLEPIQLLFVAINLVTFLLFSF